jgi:putative flavoprotein involved in K+ transport
LGITSYRLRFWGQTPWEGELRNMWKPTAQPGLWFHGGNLMQSRHYSLYLALQLKARVEGMASGFSPLI